VSGQNTLACFTAAECRAASRGRGSRMLSANEAANDAASYGARTVNCLNPSPPPRRTVAGTAGRGQRRSRRVSERGRAETEAE
jgi:hypothetical protein